MPTRLAHERRRRGWTTTQLAELIGLRDRSTVTRWERRNRRPYRRNAARLEAIFGLPLDALLAEATNAASISADGAQEDDRRTAKNEGRDEL